MGTQTLPPPSNQYNLWFSGFVQALRPPPRKKLEPFLNKFLLTQSRLNPKAINKIEKSKMNQNILK